MVLVVVAQAGESGGERARDVLPAQEELGQRQPGSFDAMKIALTIPATSARRR